MVNQSHIVTLLSHPQERHINDAALTTLKDHLGRHVDMISLAQGVACEISISESEADKVAHLIPQFHQQRIDVALQKSSKPRRKSALIADMDSTMIEQECIDELADALGIKDKVARITEQAMQGNIDFEQALRERVSLLRGLSTRVIDGILTDKITLRSGGQALVQTMRANGAYTALVSGGFTLFTDHIAKAIGFNEHRANELEITQGALTGTVIDPILGASAKVAALNDICRKRSITPKDIMAIGDGANDLAMIRTAGLGVAVHAKPKVSQAADISIHFCDLTALLYIQGYRHEDFVIP